MNKITLATFFYFKDGGRENLHEFQEKAAPIFKRHGLRIEQEFAPIGQGQIGSVENTLERPDLVQIVSFGSLEGFQAYLADDEMKALAPIRAAGLRKMTASFGPTLDIGKPEAENMPGALHFAALVTFKNKGDTMGLEEFNRRGISSGLFDRYGIMVRNIAKVQKTITPIGTPDTHEPEMIIHFSVDDQKRLKEYMADPEYLALAPLRDSELKSYLFFQGA